jgi:hypothetical protein
MTQGHFSLFLPSHFPGSLGNGTIHRSQRLFEKVTVPYCHAAWLQGAQLAGTREGQPFVPGGKIHQGKKWLEGTRDSNSTHSLESVARDDRAVAEVEE